MQTLIVQSIAKDKIYLIGPIHLFRDITKKVKINKLKLKILVKIVLIIFITLEK